MSFSKSLVTAYSTLREDRMLLQMLFLAGIIDYITCKLTIQSIEKMRPLIAYFATVRFLKNDKKTNFLELTNFVYRKEALKNEIFVTVINLY